jgi:hypothetical protein
MNGFIRRGTAFGPQLFPLQVLGGRFLILVVGNALQPSDQLAERAIPRLRHACAVRQSCVMSGRQAGISVGFFRRRYIVLRARDQGRVRERMMFRRLACRAVYERTISHGRITRALGRGCARVFSRQPYIAVIEAFNASPKALLHHRRGLFIDNDQKMRVKRRIICYLYKGFVKCLNPLIVSVGSEVLAKPIKNDRERHPEPGLSRPHQIRKRMLSINRQRWRRISGSECIAVKHCLPE